MSLMFTIVKLNAINSTNSYLKEWSRKNNLSHATVVVAEHQTQGRGQRGSSWRSEKCKNLTFSVLYKFDGLAIGSQFYLNQAVSISIYNVLSPIIGKYLSVKWPNDIMSANQKLGGILIENTVKNAAISQYIIGIGLNVNQTDFPNDLPNATSLKKITNKTFDKEALLDKILHEIQSQLLLIQKQEFDKIKQLYETVLYKKDIPSMFIEADKRPFLGKIIGVSKEGKLKIELEDEKLREFSLKEIEFA